VRHTTHNPSPIHKPNRPDQSKRDLFWARDFLFVGAFEAVCPANLTSRVEENFTQRKFSYAFEKGCEVSRSVYWVMSRIAKRIPLACETLFFNEKFYVEGVP